MEYDDTGLSQSMKHLIWASLHLRSRETPTGPLPSHGFITSLSAKNRTGWTQTQNILYLYFPLSNVKMREAGETGVNLNEVQSLHLTWKQCHLWMTLREGHKNSFWTPQSQTYPLPFTYNLQLFCTNRLIRDTVTITTSENDFVT